MAEESAKRFEEIMKKLSYSPPKLKPSSSTISNRIETLSGRKRPHSFSVGGKIAGCMVGESVCTLSNSAMLVQTPACRPWDRDDFFRRLSTFKAMSWFAKPQALKLLSLFGWEPHILPYKVEFHDGENQPIRDANVSVSAGQKAKVDVYSLFTSEAANTSRQRELDPNSIILNCNLCGASPGLWAFCTTPQPLEYLRFIGVTEVTGKNVTTTVKVSVPEGSSCQTSNGDREDVTTIATNATSSLGVTIAGGLPPAMLNYGATISLPIIGPNLRVRLLMEKGFNDNLPIEKIPQVECQSMSLENENPTAEGTADPNCEHGTRHPNNSLVSAGEGPFTKDKPVTCIRESEKLSPAYKSKEFDPIKQHRHFCPWIMSTGKFTPGWQQTFSALVGLKEPDHVPPPTLIEVDDPVASVKRLFLSPY